MRKLRQFLVMLNFHRRFLPKCAQVIKPLTDILTDVKNCDIVLSAPALTAFKQIKKILSQGVKLFHVVSGNQSYLVVDTSSFGVGTVLQQKIGDH